MSAAYASKRWRKRIKHEVRRNAAIISQLTPDQAVERIAMIFATHEIVVGFLIEDGESAILPLKGQSTLGLHIANDRPPKNFTAIWVPHREAAEAYWRYYGDGCPLHSNDTVH